MAKCDEYDEKKHRATGGVNEAKEDLGKKNEARTDAKEIDGEAEERAKGGKVKRKRGGMVASVKEGFGPEHEGTVRSKRKRGGKAMKGGKEAGMFGEDAKQHAGRSARKNGGSLKGSDTSPFTSARHGKPATHRELEPETEV